MRSHGWLCSHSGNRTNVVARWSEGASVSLESVTFLTSSSEGNSLQISSALSLNLWRCNACLLGFARRKSVLLSSISTTTALSAFCLEEDAVFWLIQKHSNSQRDNFCPITHWWVSPLTLWPNEQCYVVCKEYALCMAVIWKNVHVYIRLNLMKKGTSVDRLLLDTRHRKHLNKNQIWNDCSMHVPTSSLDVLEEKWTGVIRKNMHVWEWYNRICMYGSEWVMKGFTLKALDAMQDLSNSSNSSGVCLD